MDYLLRGGRVIDPQNNLDGDFDVLVQKGKIASVTKSTDKTKAAGGEKQNIREIDVSGMLVVPGLIDLHVHFREPGQEYKEDIESGSRSAAAGGFTRVCAMPNTKPVNDCSSVTSLMVRRMLDVGLCRVHPVGALTVGLKGEALAEYGEMKEAGAVAVSDDGRPLMDAGLMRRSLEYAKTFGLVVVQHAEDLSLSQGGVMNEGAVSTQLGLRGQPSSAESVMVSRDIDLVEWTGAAYHVAHASAEKTFELVRDAKARGLPVTCEVTPHHFALTDDACGGYDTSTKVAPPLRTAKDRDAVCAAILDGTVDCIATDHAPHSAIEKDTDFDAAAFGMIGLETAVGLTWQLVDSGQLPVQRAVELLTSGPAKVFGFDKSGAGTLSVGSPADIAVLDVTTPWVVDRDAMKSKSKNTPFHGRELSARAVMTFLDGRITHDLKGAHL